MERTRVFLNTWGNYNDGSIGYGWMTAEEAIDFMKADPERDGGEWFVADIDNYLGVDFGKLEYANAAEVCEQIQELESLDEWEAQEVIAVMEYCGCDALEANFRKDHFMIYPDEYTYLDSMDELVDFSGVPDFISRYFDYDMYHRDCMMDAYVASNGIVILD